MILSMTGFGSAEGSVGADRLAVEVRSVNHRFFNPAIKLPASMGRMEHLVRESLRRHVARGHVTLSARINPETDADRVRIDEARFGAYVAQLRALRDRFGLAGEVDVATVLRMPDVLAPRSEDIDVMAPAELLAVVDSACDALNVMRAEEGRRLAEFVSCRLGEVERALERIRLRAPVRLAEQHARMRHSIVQLVAGLDVDPQRVAQESAILADRQDVAEELDRFAAHVAAFRATLAASGSEPVGKRLGFLLQEMLREANTTGAKANDAAMLADVVLLKEELERIREQVENLE